MSVGLWGYDRRRMTTDGVVRRRTVLDGDVRRRIIARKRPTMAMGDGRQPCTVRTIRQRCKHKDCVEVNLTYNDEGRETSAVDKTQIEWAAAAVERILT